MDNWRRKSSESQNQEATRMRPQSRKPPSGNWQPTVPTAPSWERKFCWEVGRVPWRKLLETKNFIHTYENMLKWDDSAGQEAFDNAKARYWAGLNGLPCEIPWPDPNAHIDNVDWDAYIDPELYLDLDRDFVASDSSSGGERVLIFGEPYAESRGLTDNGWGDAADDFQIITDSDLEKIRENSRQVYADMAGDVAGGGIDHGGQWEVEDPWESKVGENGGGGGKGWNNSDSGWNKWESKVNNFGNNKGYNSNNMSRYKTTRFYGDESKVNDFGRNFGGYNVGGYNNGKYKESNGRNNMSRYKTTRFNNDERGNNVWERNSRNGRRRENFVHDERPCRPIDRNGAAKQGNNWGNWEKSVSGV